MCKTNFTTLALTFSLLGLTSACVVSPIHGETVNKNQPVRFEMYATTPNASIKLECRHHYGAAKWSTTVTGSANPITYGGDTLYLKKVDITIPSTCWESWGGQYITYIRPFQGTYGMAVFDAAGRSCLFSQIGGGTSPIAAGNNCRRSGKDILLYSN